MEDFKMALVQMLKEKTDSSIRLELREITKVYDLKLTAIILMKPEERISRVFYMEMCYQQYLNGASLEEIVDSIINILNDDDSKLDASSLSTVDNIFNYELVKDKLIAKLISKERNVVYLQDKAYVDYLDLAACFCILIDQPDDMVATIPVPATIVDGWGIPEKELLEVAIENMKRMLPVTLASVSDIISEMISKFKNDSFAEFMNPPTYEAPHGVYVITNERRINGAATLLYKGVLRRFAEEHQTTKVYIIPLSVHKLMLAIDTVMTDNDINNVNEIIADVNEIGDNPMEILSDHVYVYVYERDVIEY